MVVKKANTTSGKVKVMKRGGTKRKIPMEKIIDKQKLAVTYTKRKGGLFNKASQLCLLTGAQIAILATPPSSESHVSFNSFGHSSVDAVVSAFLSGQPLPPVSSEIKKQMREDIGIFMAQKSLGLGFWWEDKSFDSSEDVNQLFDASDSLSKLINRIKGELAERNHQTLDEKLKKNKAIFVQARDLDHSYCANTNQDPNLDEELIDFGNNLECLLSQDDFDDIDQTRLGESSSSISICDNTNNDPNLDEDLIDFGNNLECLLSEDDFDDTQHIDQTTRLGESSSSICDNHLLPEAYDENLDQDMDFDELIDYDTTLESLVSGGFFNNLEDLHDFTSSILMDSEPNF